MVMYKYCPRCCSLDVIKENTSENYRCRSCNYVGSINTDSIDQINALRVKVKGGVNYSNYASAPSMQKNTSPIQKSMSSASKGIEGRDYEILGKKKEDTYNSEIPEIDKGGEDIDISKEQDDINNTKESENVNIPKEQENINVSKESEVEEIKKEIPFKSEDNALPPHGLRPKETKSLKERLREKGAGKDWDIL